MGLNLVWVGVAAAAILFCWPAAPAFAWPLLRRTPLGSGRRQMQMTSQVQRAGGVAWWNRGVDVAALYLELYDRIPPLVRRAVDGLDLEQLTEPPSPDANPIAWLVWHVARVQDDHIAEILDADQLWVVGDWARRFGLEPDPGNTGFGHSADEVASVRPESPEVLVDYLDAVMARTRTLLKDLVPAELDRIVDWGWDPPVTLGVRLVSVVCDNLQHAGQAAYVRGLLGR